MFLLKKLKLTNRKNCNQIKSFISTSCLRDEVEVKIYFDVVDFEKKHGLPIPK